MKNQEAIVAHLDRIEESLSGFAPQSLISLNEQDAQKSPGAENRGPES